MVIGVIIGVVGLAGLVYGLYGGVDTVGVVGLMTGTVGIGVITSRRGNLLDDCNSILLEDASVLPSEISFSLWFNAGEEDGLWLSSNVPEHKRRPERKMRRYCIPLALPPISQQQTTASLWFREL